MTTFASLFGGGGLADIGAIQAGCETIWTVEYDSSIAEWHCKNVPGEVIVARVQDVDPAGLPVPDILWASPVCTRASVANSGAVEAEEDATAAEAVCRFLRVMQPKGFILENVAGYRTFAAMNRIRAALTEIGYWWDETIQNSANYSVAQTRKRFIVRAVLGGFLPPYPSPTRWVGWYEAIEDLIPTLPPSRFADWQLARLPQELGTTLVTNAGNQPNGHVDREPVQVSPDEPCPPVTQQFNGRVRAFLANTREMHGGKESEASEPLRSADEPVYSLPSTSEVSRHKAFLLHGTSTMELREEEDPSAAVMATVHAKAAMPKAFLVDGKPFNYAGDLQTREAAQPVPPLTASQTQHPLRAFLMPVQGENAEAREQAAPALTVTASHAAEKHRAWLSQGRVVSMTPRALARFQSMPDSYELPPNKRLACQIIGNGIPCRMSEAIVRTVMEAIG